MLSVGQLDPQEAEELGPLLRATAAVAAAFTPCEQVYVTLWSHSDATPQHIHWVVQPITRRLMAEHDGLHGPRLQAEMFRRGAPPDPIAIEAIAERLREQFAVIGPPE